MTTTFQAPARGIVTEQTWPAIERRRRPRANQREGSVTKWILTTVVLTIDTFCAVKVWIDPPARYTSDAFSVARDLGPIWIWGVVLAAIVGVHGAGSILRSSRLVTVSEVGLAAYWCWWLIVFTAAYLSAPAAIFPPVLAVFAVVAHVALPYARPLRTER